MDSSPCDLCNIEVEAEGESFDLHNCFHFVGFEYQVRLRTIYCRWIPNEYAPAGETRTLLVAMIGVSHFSATPRDPELPYKEDDCLAGAYKVAPGDPLEYAGVYPRPEPHWHYVLSFMSGLQLRIACDEVRLTTTTGSG